MTQAMTENDFLMQRERDRERFLEKALPSAPDSERILIGTVFLDNRIIDELMNNLKPEMCYSPWHRNLLDAIYKVANNKEYKGRIDPIMVGEELRKIGSLESMGGLAAITNTTYGLPTWCDVMAHIKLIKDKHALRELVKRCDQITSECLAEQDDTPLILTRAEKLVGDVANENRADNKSAVSVKSVLAKFNDKIKNWLAGGDTAIPTFSPKMNTRLREGGTVLGDLSIVLARPSDGKTTFGTQNAWHAAQHYCPSLIITLEQGDDEIIEKVIAGETYVPNYKIRKELFFSAAEQDVEYVNRLRSIQASMANMEGRFFIDENSKTLSQIIASMWHHVTKHGVKFIFIDYGGLIVNDMVANPRQTTREREVAQIIAELKAFAKLVTRTKPKVHVMLAWQLSRSAEEGKKPTYKDARETGAVEQDADLLLAPYGEKVGGEIIMRAMKMACLKQRKGRKDWEIPIWLNGDLQRFYDAQMREDDRDNLREAGLADSGDDDGEI